MDETEGQDLMSAVPQGLDGYWSCFAPENSPLPPHSFGGDLAAGKHGRVWMSVYVTHPPDPIAQPYAFVLTDGVDWFQHQFGEQGLPAGSIDHMAVDSRDRVWFCADNAGVYCFDGRSTTVYEYGQAGLPKGDWLASLYVDASDQVWCAMLLHGVYRLSGNSWQRVIDSNTKGFRDYSMALGVDRDGHLWAASADSQGASFLSLKSGRWDVICSFPEGYEYLDMVNCLVVDRYERVWVGLEHCGLLVWDSGHWNELSKRDCPLLSGEIRSLTIDEFDNLWVGTSGGFAVFDRTRWYAWEAILPGFARRPVSRQDLSDLDSKTRSTYVHIGNRMAIDSLRRKWIGSAKGVVLFSPQPFRGIASVTR